jgi:hypothetical protein
MIVATVTGNQIKQRWPNKQLGTQTKTINGEERFLTYFNNAAIIGDELLRWYTKFKNHCLVLFLSPFFA